jgi:AraC-like DNA-binding protein
MTAVAGWRLHPGVKPPQTLPHTRRTTDDRDEAERVISELYLPNRLELAKGSSALGMEVTVLRLGSLTAGRLTYGRDVRLRTADAENFHVNIPLRGRATSRSGSREPVTTGPGDCLVFSPGAPADIVWTADCEQLCLMIERPRLEAELEHLLGQPLGRRLVFDFSTNLRSPMGRRWRTMLELLLHELDQPTAVTRSSRMARHVEGLVIDGLLLGQPHSHSDLAIRERPAGMSTAISRAVEMLEERPSHPWTTIRLAAEVHLSVRALQAGFARDLGTPPMTYLRQVRLRRAHEVLSAAEPGATSVREVAHALGMLHKSRFAAAYRDAFGEAPSETLNHPR